MPDLSEHSSDAAAIITATEAAAIAAATPAPVTGFDWLYTAATPEGVDREILDFEKFAEFPRRKTGHVKLTTSAALAAYVNTHREMGTTLYSDGDNLRVIAVINDHTSTVAAQDAGFDGGMPGHRDHRATLTLKRTPGCKRWLDAHGKYMGQEEFAQLIEDGLTEIGSPAGADLLELAQTMHAQTSASFRSGIRLQDGRVQFSYVEEIDAKAGADGKMTIPAEIMLVLQPFYGAEVIQIGARLRYRISGGKLTLGVWLIQHVEKLMQAFDDEVEEIARMTEQDAQPGTALVALAGTPE